MGIQGLLPVLKNITQSVHVSKYKGHKVAVDAYCWLHKGAYCCAQELCEGQYTDKHVAYCMQKVQMLQHCGVAPLVVFDGGRLPMKAAEEGSRHRARQENRDKAAAHVKAGNRQAALECYQRAVGISPETANDFVQALKKAGVEFIVAPFEADAQMAYLAINGMVHAVITEDSDLLPYGCPRVLFKMDKNGEGQEIVAAELGNNRELSFIGFTPQMILEMCIFAGCDFLKALPGIGMKKAHQHVKRLKSHRKVCKSLRFSGISVPRDYEAAFQRAVWTFQHQRVWCPKAKQLVHVRPLPAGGLASVDAVPGALPEEDEALDFLGPVQPDVIMQQVAEGDLNPVTLEPFAPRSTPQHGQSAASETKQQGTARPWQFQRRASGGRASGERKPLTLPVQANGITSYFPSLSASSDALQQFSAPRPALRSRSNSPGVGAGSNSPGPAAASPSGVHRSSPFFGFKAQAQKTRHSSCLSKPSTPADGHHHAETAGLCHVATSPASKASRHLSGCGSQPEPMLHAFSSFAADSGKRSHIALHQQTSRAEAAAASSTQLQPPGMQQPPNTMQAAPVVKSSLHGKARSPSPAVAQDEAEAAARLNNLMTASIEPCIDQMVAKPDAEGLGSSPSMSPFKAAAQQSPSVPHDSIPEADADPGGSQACHASTVRSSSREGSAKRRISLHFETAKRRRSNEAGNRPESAAQYGVLGGLVSHLQLHRSDSNTSQCPDSHPQSDDIDVELDARNNIQEQHNEQAVPASNLYDDISETETEMPRNPIAGLEHIQPFASIANLAVENIRSSSLQQFAMTGNDRSNARKAHADVFRPFAAPRRSDSTSIQPKSRQTCVMPVLQKFACNVNSKSLQKE